MRRKRVSKDKEETKLTFSAYTQKMAISTKKQNIPLLPYTPGCNFN